MHLHLVALNPTDSVTAGFLPAAAELGGEVTLFTDRAAPHEEAYAGSAAAPARIVTCDVRDVRALVAAMSTAPRPDAVFSNSDHLQTQTALAAAWFGLPGKDWRAALRTKNKALMRRHLADRGSAPVWSAELPGDRTPDELIAVGVPFPCVVKPREGVASEDAYLVADGGELLARCREIRARTPGIPLVVEEFLDGELHTLETLGDTRGRRVLGGFHTKLSPPPSFVEESLAYDAAPGAGALAGVERDLDALGVGFGACHTEFVVGADGRARLVEVNYRVIGDQCDLLLQDLLDIPVFAQILRVHLGESLSALPAPRRGDRRAARVEYVCADASGTLVAAPPAEETAADGVRLTYRPLREVGTTAPRTGTNRDYLGVVRAMGPDQARTDAAVARFIAARRWEIRG
ncbi:ATP-grasp domain-containing protein [Yinghuangia sp. ASG 101]|uniref:ATP-grasp domain-containing protein n=1 Tax=Yinghuangia sp. ASG 101 TaxID=2896848 RepID=UPI001E369D3E|nr:ATP-grasp domain-containing protein [Yinghuangia sp. ASG 101]UGQ10894.1 ATP-grasp domain-containing protein [Yinghuangia sp. ASG 101]